MTNITLYNKMPIPNGRWRKYPWDKMRVGQSFSVKSKASGHALCAQAMKTRKGKRFECHMIDGVCWIWRTA